jgi:hypothetical protein
MIRLPLQTSVEHPHASDGQHVVPGLYSEPYLTTFSSAADQADVNSTLTACAGIAKTRCTIVVCVNYCVMTAACRYMSSVEHSHTSVVGDVCWLPGIEVDRTGKVFPIRANSAGTSAQVRGLNDCPPMQ